MPSRKFPNYLRSARKRSGLSQDEIAFLLGGHNGGKVSRYERFNRLPSLATACVYEALFGVPVSELFGGVFEKACGKMKKRAELLARKLDVTSRDPSVAQKLQLLQSVAQPQVIPSSNQS